MFPVPSKLTPPSVLAVASLVAVSALPVRSPVTFPVTLPVTLPVKLPVTLPVRLPTNPPEDVVTPETSRLL